MPHYPSWMQTYRGAVSAHGDSHVRDVWQSIATLVLLCWLTVSAPEARVVSEELRARMLAETAQLAHYVVVGSVVDTTCLYLHPDAIATEYTVQVDHYLKGPVASDSLVSFVQRGGTLGSRSQSMSTAYHFEIGESYLLFLGYCEQPDRWRLWCLARDLVAHLQGPTASFRGSAGSGMNVVALVDSTQAAVATGSLGTIAEQADLIVQGHLLDFENRNVASRLFDNGTMVVGSTAYLSIETWRD